MTREELLMEAVKFRGAIENARDKGEFTIQRFKSDRMKHFPYDCCDDTADLFVHYLYHVFGIDSIRVDSEYYDNRLKCTCGHSWQETDGWLIDLTGDQFTNDPSVQIKSEAVYVGKMDSFHRQFMIKRKVHSCGIECLGDGSWERMYGLYSAIMKYINIV